MALLPLNNGPEFFRKKDNKKCFRINSSPTSTKKKKIEVTFPNENIYRYEVRVGFQGGLFGISETTAVATAFRFTETILPINIEIQRQGWEFYRIMIMR